MLNAHISWAKANIDDRAKYRHLLSQLLDLIEVPTGALLCTDGSCCYSNHIKAVNKYATDVSNACSHAADSVIPWARSGPRAPHNSTNQCFFKAVGSPEHESN